MIVLVTGCRSGIGFHIALEAAKAGHTVYAGLRQIDTGGALLEATQGLNLIPLQLDITQEDQRQAAVEKIRSEQGKLHVLVNNAGLGLGGFLELVDEDEMRKVFDVNVFGSLAMTRAFLPMMREAQSGKIIMISSMSGRMAIPFLGVYCGSKFALEGLSEALRHELSPFGIEVVIVEPGAYKTDMVGGNSALCRRLDSVEGYRSYAQNMMSWYRSIAIENGGDPAEVGRFVVSLLPQKNPALRYTVGYGTKKRSIALRLIPFRLIEKIFRRAMQQGK